MYRTLNDCERVFRTTGTFLIECKSRIEYLQSLEPDAAVSGELDNLKSAQMKMENSIREMRPAIKRMKESPEKVAETVNENPALWSGSIRMRRT